MRWCSLGKRARLGASRVNQPSPPKKKTSKLGGMILECDGQHGWHSKQRDTKSSLSAQETENDPVVSFRLVTRPSRQTRGSAEWT